MNNKSIDDLILSSIEIADSEIKYMPEEVPEEVNIKNIELLKSHYKEIFDNFIENAKLNSNDFDIKTNTLWLEGFEITESGKMFKRTLLFAIFIFDNYPKGLREHLYKMISNKYDEFIKLNSRPEYKNYKCTLLNCEHIVPIGTIKGEIFGIGYDSFV